MAEAEILFDRYQLHERIGAGGTGVVWRATDLLLDQPVALKRIPITDADPDRAEQNRARALREARAAARLRRHPHVVAIYDIQVADGDIWRSPPATPRASSTGMSPLATFWSPRTAP